VIRVTVCVVEEKIMLSSPIQLLADTWQVKIFPILPFLFKPQLLKITTGPY